MAGRKENFRKALAWKLDIRLAAALCVTALLLFLVPLFRIALYAAPWYDDYTYGIFVRNFLREEHSLASAIRGAVYCVETQWWAWQGTFSSVFFMSLVPLVWGEEYYFLGPLFLILLLVFSVFVLVHVLVRDVLKAGKAECVLLQSVTASMAVVLIYNTQMGFFWYNAGLHYVGMHSFFLLLAAAWIKLLTKCGRGWIFLSILWSLAGAVIVSGANFVTALQGGVAALGLFGFALLLKNRRCFFLIPSICIYAVGFYQNVAAPGNQKRSMSYQGWGLDPVNAVLQSFVEGIRHLWEFSGMRTVAIVILLTPIIWGMVKKLDFHFRCPGILLLASYCFYATGFTPSLYTLGHAGLARTLNAVKLTWQVLLLVNEVYFLGWLRIRQEKAGWLRGEKLGERNQAGAPVLFSIAIIFLMLVIFAVDPYKIGNYSSWGAYFYVHEGEAYNFHQGYLDRVEQIKEGGPVVTVKPIGFRPWMLSPGELSEDSASEPNKAVADWYGKEAVICKP